MKKIFYLVQKEFVLDFKQASGILSVLVYLISILFFISILFKNNYTPVSYSSLYIIIFLFTSLIASYRNFTKEENDSELFNYIIYSPIEYITGKIIYSILLNIVLATLLTVFFILFNGFLIANTFLFLINILGLCIGLGGLLSLMGSISGKSRSNFTLMSIMSFPLLLPLVIISAKLSIASIQDISISMNLKYIISLFSLDIIILILSVILFPQVWTE